MRFANSFGVVGIPASQCEETMSILNPFSVLPVFIIGLFVFATALYRRVKYPSPLVWGSTVSQLGPVRAHLVLDYNEQLDDEKASGESLGREDRRQQFQVNWGYLGRETKNTTLFLQALRFEKMKIKRSKPSLHYERLEAAIVELIREATELRVEQVRRQLDLQLRYRLGLEIDRDVFLTLLVGYKNLEKHIITLAEVEGSWLKDMLLERLGLAEWRVIQGGQA